MPAIGITTGKDGAPRLDLIELSGTQGEDWDYAISFEKGRFVLWFRHTPDDSDETKFTVIKKFVIKITSDGDKITNAEKISETEFTAPELPPADTLDPYYFYWSTYNKILEAPTPCEEESLTRFKLVIKKNSAYTSTDPAQLIPKGDTLDGEPLNVFLKTHHALKQDSLDNRATFFAGAMRNDTDTIEGNDTTGGTLQCIYDPDPTDFLVPIAGLMLSKEDNPDDFVILDFVGVQY